METKEEIKEEKQETFELTITADGVKSTCDEFTMENLADGWRFRPTEVCFQRGRVLR